MLHEAINCSFSKFDEFYLNNIFLGVGGHGGSGIHADLESKYQEIIQRTSIYAKREPRATVDLSPRGEGGMKPFSYDAPGEERIIEISTPSPARTPLMLPGYGTLTMEVCAMLTIRRICNLASFSKATSKSTQKNCPKKTDYLTMERRLIYQ